MVVLVVVGVEKIVGCLVDSVVNNDIIDKLVVEL